MEYRINRFTLTENIHKDKIMRAATEHYLKTTRIKRTRSLPGYPILRDECRSNGKRLGVHKPTAFDEHASKFQESLDAEFTHFALDRSPNTIFDKCFVVALMYIGPVH